MKEDLQEYLLRITKLYAEDFSCEKLRGITAIWKNNNSCFSFYFSEPPTEEEIEDASVLCTEIIAALPGGGGGRKLYRSRVPQTIASTVPCLSKIVIR